MRVCTNVLYYSKHCVASMIVCSVLYDLAIDYLTIELHTTDEHNRGLKESRTAPLQGGGGGDGGGDGGSDGEDGVGKFYSKYQKSLVSGLPSTALFQCIVANHSGTSGTVPDSYCCPGWPIVPEFYCGPILAWRMPC